MNFQKIERETIVGFLFMGTMLFIVRWVIPTVFNIDNNFMMWVGYILIGVIGLGSIDLVARFIIRIMKEMK
jgi:hypothetical protein